MLRKRSAPGEGKFASIDNAGGEEVLDLAIIAQVVSAVGTVGLTILFGLQLRVFYRQVLVNRDTLKEIREARVSHERPQVVVTAEYRHGNLVPLLREMELHEGILVTSRYESLTGERYETLWTINPLLMPGDLYAASATK